MTGKPQPFKRTRTSTRRVGWERGEKSWRRLFLHEIARSNNELRAIEHAHIRWSTYLEWRESGFLTDTMLEEAQADYHRRHPTVESLPSHTPDQDLEDAGYAVAALEPAMPIEIPTMTSLATLKEMQRLRSQERDVLDNPEGWSGDYELDE